MDGKDKTKDVDNVQKKKIRISITSRNVRNIERCANGLVQKAKSNNQEAGNIEVRGPIRMPTRHLKMTVRKSPCGNGSKTFDRYELKIHKRVIDLVCTLPQLTEITNMKIDSGVDIELNFNETDSQD